MEELIEIVEVKSTKYVLLSTESYAGLNDRISDVMGFDIGLPTERYAPVIPMLAKVNIQFTGEGEDVIEIFDTIPVMPITATVQDRCTELLTHLTLIDTYIPVQTVEV